MWRNQGKWYIIIWDMRFNRKFDMLWKCRKWLNFDSNDPGFQIMSDADIVSNVTQTEERECDTDSENTSEEDTDNHISVRTAVTSVETLLDFVDQRGFEYSDKISLRKIRKKFENYWKILKSKLESQIF